MSFKKKALSTLLAMSLVFSSFNIPTYANENPDLVIIFNNDTHSRTHGDSTTAGIKDYYESNNIPTVLLHAGDAIHGQSLASLTDGAAIVEIMNLDNYDALTMGNHEFNYGIERLLELSDLATFNFLANNVVYKENDNTLFEPYIVLEKGDLSIGVIGVSTPETLVKADPSYFTDVDITAPYDATLQAVEELEALGVDYTIALTHLGVDGETEEQYRSTYIAEYVDGIDLVVDGHSHTFLEEGLYFDDTLLVQTGEYFKNIGVLEVYDINGDTSYELKYISPGFDENNPLPAELEGFVPNQDVEALVEKLNADTEAITSEVIGYTPVLLEGERGDVRTRETNLTSLIADALIDATDADIALANGGNTRSSIDVGDITLGEVITVWPFGNMAVTIEVTGQEVIDAIENGIQSYPDTAGQFPHLAGVIVQFDPEYPAGSRIVSITNEDGTPFDVDATYVLATNEFLANGGDGYTMFADNPVKEYFSIQSDIVIDYIQAGNEIPSEPAGRLTVREVPDFQQPVVDPVPPTDVVEPVSIDPVEPITVEVTYTVQQGDYLSKIAVMFNTTWSTLAEVNEISNPNLIFPGQVIVIK